MKTTITEKDGVVVIAVEGELDTNTSAQFQADIAPVMEMEKAKVELDLSKLEYISSKALRVVVALQQTVHKNGGTFSIIAVSDTVSEIFQMTGLSQFMYN